MQEQLSLARRQIRQQARRQRRSLSAIQQRNASKKLSLHVRRVLKTMQRQHAFGANKNSAFYLAQDGEIQFDGRLRINPAAMKDQAMWLPKITSKNSMQFRTMSKPLLASRQMRCIPKIRRRPSGMRLNRFKIPEPTSRNYCSSRQLRFIFIPLVAADSQGGRIGMGGGYYDRALSRLKPWLPRPITIGICHSCQIFDTLPLVHWDEKLDYVISDQGVVHSGA